MVNRDVGNGYPEQPLDDPDWDQDEQLNERPPVALEHAERALQTVPHNTGSEATRKSGDVAGTNIT
jgi:hypothetical protein